MQPPTANVWYAWGSGGNRLFAILPGGFLPLSTRESGPPTSNNALLLLCKNPAHGSFHHRHNISHSRAQSSQPNRFRIGAA